jgi:hypothetical protein
MITDSIIVTPLPSVPAPSSQAHAATSSNNQEQDSGQTQNANQTSTQNAQQNGQSQNQNTSGSNNASTNNNDSHFSKLLSDHSQTDNANTPKNSTPATSTPVPTPPSSAPTKTTNGANANESAGASSASGSADGSASSNVLVALLLSQLQQSSNNGSIPQDNTQSISISASSTSGTSTSGISTATSGSGSSASSSTATDALTQLQQLIVKLLQLAQQNAASPATNAVTASSGSGSATTTQSKIDASGDKSNTDAASLTEILIQIAALVQQINTQPAATTPIATTNTDTTDATVNSDAGGNSQAALLAQLTRQLEQKLNTLSVNTNSTENTSASSGSGSATQATTPSFDAALSALLQANDNKDALQAALAKVNDLLAPTFSSKQDPNNSNDDQTAKTTTPQTVIPGFTQTINQSQDTGFTKLVSAPAATTPVADQVLVQIKNAISDGSSQIKIQLSPADLGKVVVQLTTTSDGKTGITITADNRQTLSMLQNEARALESSLRNIGLKTDTGGLSFNLSGQQQNQQQSGKQGGYTQVANVDTESDADYYSAATTVYRLAAQDGLDIRV